MTGNEPWHGKAHGYTVYKCRCDECKKAGAKHNRNMYLNRVMADKPDDDPRHGTNNFYVNWGCRCERCSEAGRAYLREGRLRRQRRAARRSSGTD